MYKYAQVSSAQDLSAPSKMPGNNVQFSGVSGVQERYRVGVSLSLSIRSLIPSSCAGPEVLVKVCAFGRAVVGVIHLCCVPLPFYQQSEKVESSVMAPKRRRASRRKAAPKKGKKGGRNGVVLDAVCVRSDFMWAHACSWSTVGRS